MSCWSYVIHAERCARREISVDLCEPYNQIGQTNLVSTAPNPGVSEPKLGQQMQSGSVRASIVHSVSAQHVIRGFFCVLGKNIPVLVVSEDSCKHRSVEQNTTTKWSDTVFGTNQFCCRTASIQRYISHRMVISGRTCSITVISRV